MDTSDPKIRFDSDGFCDHCSGFVKYVLPGWKNDDLSQKAHLDRLLAKIKRTSVNLKYDCILGLSGGLDSSFLLHNAVTKFGLRPLVFHVDGGWNTELAVKNIESLVEKLNIDLFTEVIDWEDMRDFQLTLFKSGTPHLDIAQDHAFFATMFHYAKKHNIKYILNGGNYSTECIRNPKDWIYYGTDMSFIRDIRNRFGTRDLESYPWSGILYHKVYLRYVRGIKVVRPLNYISYRQQDAIRTLEESYGWRYYGQKHFESRFTKFYEGFWLPARFGYDTRRVQLSSLIVTGQLSRDAAINELAKPSYNEEEIESDLKYISSKLNVTTQELKTFFNLPKRSFRDYKNEDWLFDLGARVLRLFGEERLIKR